MTDFLEILDGPKRPEPQFAPGPVNRDATKYAIAALEGECANVRAVPIGSGRNAALNVASVKMGGLIAAGAIDEATVTEHLGAADGGLDYPATRATIASGLRFGMQQARAIPDRSTPSAIDSGRSDDPFSDSYVPRTATTGASGSIAPPSGDATDAATGEAPDPYARAVAQEAARQRINRDARRHLDNEDATKLFRVPPYLPTLTAELALPDEPTTYAVAHVIPTGANVLLTAQFKTGKTTVVNALTRSLADREPFLGRYDVAALDGRVALFNYEVDARQYRRWLRDIGITNTDAVAVLNLRGFRLPLTVPHIEDWTVEWLKAAEARVWIVDPFARAYTGSGDENDNSEVGRFLDTLDVIKERAGVSELILPTHTGRAEFEEGAERARGATRLDDWADVRWLLTKDSGTNVRFFRATGRDVETDESALKYDENTRMLTLTDGNRYETRRDGMRNAVLTILGNKPGVGASDLREGVRQIVGRVDNKMLTDTVAYLLERGEIHTRREGKTRAHYVGRGDLDEAA